MQKEDGRNCWQYQPATYGSHHAISHHGWLSNCTKILDFQSPLSTESGMMCYQERYPLLMKCSKTFIRCIKPMIRASLSIFLPLMALTKTFSTRLTLNKCTQNAKFQGPSQHRKLGVILQWETSIAYEVYQNLPQMHAIDWRSFFVHLIGASGSHWAIFHQ